MVSCPNSFKNESMWDPVKETGETLHSSWPGYFLGGGMRVHHWGPAHTHRLPVSVTPSSLRQCTPHLQRKGVEVPLAMRTAHSWVAPGQQAARCRVQLRRSCSDHSGQKAGSQGRRWRRCSRQGHSAVATTPDRASTKRFSSTPQNCPVLKKQSLWNHYSPREPVETYLINIVYHSRTKKGQLKLKKIPVTYKQLTGICS